MTPSCLLRILAVLAAVAAIVLARLALTGQAWLDLLLALIGQQGRNDFDLFPGVIGGGHIACLFVATIACAVLAWALPPVARDRVDPCPVGPAAPSARWLSPLSILAVVLAGVAAVLLRADEPRAVAAWTWLSALVVSGLVAWRLDRRRGTPFGNPFPERRGLLTVASLVLVDLVLVGHDVAHWAWAGTPDEGNFFPFAKSIAQGDAGHFILAEAGMYNVHPLLSSHWQALWMRVFGLDVFGWRLSSAAALALALPGVYVIGRELWSRRFGLWAAILFGTTPLAMGFSHFGYNNSQIYVFVVGAPAAFLWARRRRSALGYWLTGVVGGLSVFTFYPARMALPLVALMALSLGERPWARPLRQVWVVLAVAAVIAATPILVHPVDSLGRMFGQTSFRSGDDTPRPWSERIGEALAGKGARLARHWSVSVLSPFWYPRPSHFQTTSVVDPLQGALALTGFFLAWRSFRRQAGARFLALAFALSALLVGAVSQHDCPPLTRLLFLCPFTALLAVLTLERLLAPLRRSVRGARAATWLGTIAVCASALWGVAVLRYNVYVRNHGYGEGTTSEILRLAHHLPPEWRIVFVQRWPSYMQGVDNFAAAYDDATRMAYLRQSEEVVKHLPAADRRRVLFAHDLPEGEARAEVEATMQERFPGHPWQETAPGKKWNLHLMVIGKDGEALIVPRLPERSEAGRVLLGSADW